jgi:hypothetical protein
LDGKVFQNLANFEYINLKENVCIDEIFETPTAIEIVQQTVTDKCSQTLTVFLYD